MRRIIGIGETIFDILFRNDQPYKGVPGGSVFNSLISLGRLGLNPVFISEVGRDHIGDLILQFMVDNGVATDHMFRYYDGKSPVSLAFLNDQKEASYDFYMSYPNDRLDIVWPRIDADDVLLFGSFYSLKAELRPVMNELLQYALERKALIYYDPNLRSNHATQALRLMPSIIENLEFADVVRGSKEDFYNIYKETDVDKIYRNHIRFYCPIFLCTDGENGVYLRTPQVSKHYPAEAIEPVSLVGAGDSFNAGLIYGMTKLGVKREQLVSLTESHWDKLIYAAQRFAKEVCRQDENYISADFAKQIAEIL
ncbi:MAG: carbohydrate kinase family protein [Bacteroidales bacterium]